MSSINLGSFGDNWFSRPPNPSSPLNFAFLGARNLPFKKPPTASATATATSTASPSEPPGPNYSQMLDQFWWECEARPDHRHTPEVDRILSENPLFDPHPNPTPEEAEENKAWWEEFRNSPVVKFLRRSEQIADKINELELKENEHPYRREDRKLWEKLPHVPGLDGRPMPRKAIKTRRESDDKFWDFARQFFLGLWGFRQRPYPPGRPNDVAQAIGYKRLEKRYYDFRLGAAATAFLHKLQKGMSPWKPLKGFEKKSYKQLQEEAIESKRRDLAVLEANGGIWPGVKTPSHALFLWASGSELTSILEADHMPNKYISKELRYRLAEVIPGLRPWEVLSVEQAMDQITYAGEWYREPLGSYTTGPPYIRHWNKDVKRMFRIFYNLSYRVYNKLARTIPGFDQVMVKVRAEAIARDERRKAKREER